MSFVKIDGHSDIYSVSKSGVIRNDTTAKILKPWLNKHSGYLQVTLYNPKKRYTVHSIVANAFCTKIETLYKINIDHLDMNKLNNKSSNLEYVTASTNTKRAYKHKKSVRKSQIGISKPQTVKTISLTIDERSEIVDAYFSGVSVLDIVKVHKCDPMTIYRQINSYREEIGGVSF